MTEVIRSLPDWRDIRTRRDKPSLASVAAKVRMNIEIKGLYVEEREEENSKRVKIKRVIASSVRRIIKKCLR